MDELYIQVSSRFRRVGQVAASTIQGDAFRVLKQEQRVRCEKQNFLLNMLKISRVVSSEQKIDYFRKSLAIMQVINKQFEYEQLTDEAVSESFLDSFVGLYKAFFEVYEQALQFKTRIKNFLRPTNVQPLAIQHNIVIDLVKYLVDFSRDYYQQTFMWQTRQRLEQQQQELQQQQLAIMSKTNSDRMKLKPISIEEKEREKPRKPELVDLWRNYQPLDAVIVSCPLDAPLEVCRIRINDMFRDSKLRNIGCKTTIDRFRQRYNTKMYGVGSNPRMLLPIEPINNFPFKIALLVDRNNHTTLTIDRRTGAQSLTKDSARDSRLDPSSSLSKPIQQPSQQPLITQTGFMPSKNYSAEARPRGMASDYLLSSLKILRMSENFLPPLMNIYSNKPQKIEKNIEQMLVKRASTNDPMRYFNGEMQEEQQPRPQRNKLRSIKRSQSPISEVQVSLQAEQRLIQWLGKIRTVKDIERKKVMGLRGD